MHFRHGSRENAQYKSIMFWCKNDKDVFPLELLAYTCFDRMSYVASLSTAEVLIIYTAVTSKRNDAQNVFFFFFFFFTLNLV